MPALACDPVSQACRYARQEWQKLRERNEALDTRVYARAAAWIMGADRWVERMWRQLEDQAGVSPPVPDAGGTAANADDPSAPTNEPPARQAGAPPTTARRKRQTYTPRFMR
ncbi:MULTISPECIES: terminase gpA endonuclease subunit [Rhodobacterales]|uniref:terminase gpA endonuclease subunit n=1 Tax=Rhodobacterales TaxID=204455 RepID=UPI004057FF24